MSRRNRYLWIVLGVAIAFVAIPIAMSSIVVAPQRLYPGGATPGGYTRSLILFVLPVTAYLVWFAITKRKDRRRRTPFLITIGIIAVAWTVLDTLLARSFFTFPDPDATLGFNIPGWDPETGWGLNVPIEELLFYVLGALFLVLSYIWASEAWFPDRDLDEEDYHGVWPGWKGFMVPSILLGGGLAIVAAVVVKQFTSAPGWFPGYFTFIVIFVAVPSLMIFRVGFRFINLPAFQFTVLTIVIIAMLWEVTLALPYGWWGYRPSQMIGLFIRPWSDLPIEAAMLWVAAAWSNVSTYELARLWYHRNEPAAAQSGLGVEVG
jgi:hypothetical protein